LLLDLAKIKSWVWIGWMVGVWPSWMGGGASGTNQSTTKNSELTHNTAFGGYQKIRKYTHSQPTTENQRH
jgi:hypothetical protein